MPGPAHRPQTLADAQPGDIVLLAPASWASEGLRRADRFYRVADALAQGEIFTARPVQAPVSHALTFVKKIGGRSLFLDNTPKGDVESNPSGGTQIIDEREFERRYGGRPIYLARPEQCVDGRKLWDAARDAALRHAAYGVFNGRMTCADTAAITVGKATRVDPISKRLGPIDTTPGDFFDDNRAGKFFLICPLGAERSR